MTPTPVLAAWAAETSDEWSDIVVNQAVRAFIDTVACMLSGAHESPVQKVYNGVARWGGGRSTVVGNRLDKSRCALAAPWAALVNGTAAHSQDYDDVLDFALAHVSAAIVPALLALAEETGASGQKCVDAYIVGFEIMTRLAEFMNPAHYQRGWHTTLTLGPPAVAVACGRVIGLDRPRMNAALSLSTSMSSGSKRQFGTMAKPIHAGLAAKNGILAARLAAEGITAAEEMLEGKWSISDLMHGSNPPGFSDCLSHIGDPLALIQYGVWLKPYPCCASAHRSVDAALHLRSAYDIDPPNVNAIEAMISNVAADNLMYASPEDPVQARFSLHYCLASALIDGGLGPESFTEKAVQRWAVRELLPRIHKTINPAFDKDQRSSVTIRLANGQEVSKTVDTPRGHPAKPLSDEELADKFRACATAGGLNKKETEKLYLILDDFISLQQIDELSRHLCPKGGMTHGK
jgi:2-methylcitrate dehydratase PrpD